jgi:transposase
VYFFNLFLLYLITPGSAVVAEIGEVSDYDNARQLAAYAGLTPSERSSGTSVKGKTRLSCTGNVRLRKALYMPAVVAMRHNPLVRIQV